LTDLESGAERLVKMTLAFKQVTEFEKRKIHSDMKILAWKRFANTFAENNPYSQEDDEMRQKAMDQIAYWQKREETELSSGSPNKKNLKNGSENRKQQKPVTELEKFLSELEPGEHVVIVNSCLTKQEAQKKVERIKAKYPELFQPQIDSELYEKYGEGKYFDGEIWAVYVGGFYSGDPSSNTKLERFLSQLELGEYLLIVASCRSKKEAQKKVERIKSKCPELFSPQRSPDMCDGCGEGKYWDGKYWVVYVGEFYSLNSSKLLREKLAKELRVIEEDSFIKKWQ